MVRGGPGGFQAGPLPCSPGPPERLRGLGAVEGYTPEHHSVVEVADGGQAGDGPLRGKARLHEGPRVEHAQEPVDDDLRGAVKTRAAGCGLVREVSVCSRPAGRGAGGGGWGAWGPGSEQTQSRHRRGQAWAGAAAGAGVEGPASLWAALTSLPLGGGG